MPYFLQFMQLRQLESIAVEFGSMFRIFHFQHMRKPYRKCMSGERFQHSAFYLSRKEGGCLDLLKDDCDNLLQLFFFSEDVVDLLLQ